MKKTLERLRRAAQQLEDAKHQTEETITAIVTEKYIRQERENLRVLDTSESQKDTPQRKRATADRSATKKR